MYWNFFVMTKLFSNDGKSMPSRLPDEEQIPIARFFDSKEGLDKEAYADKHYKDSLNSVFSQFTDFEKDTVIRSLGLLNKAITQPCC